jgi:hypothetical protein
MYSGARPHWAKLTTMNPLIVTGYMRAPDFEQLTVECDPPSSFATNS